MKMIIAYIAGGLLAAIAVTYFAGRMIPEDHVASVSAEYAASPDRIYAVISDPGRFMEWRTTLKSVAVKDGVITEVSSFGPMAYRFAEQDPPHRLVTADASGPDKGWTGSWTFAIEPNGSGSKLTITERGRVYSPFFRLMSKFFFSHEETARKYHVDLAKRLG